MDGMEGRVFPHPFLFVTHSLEYSILARPMNTGVTWGVGQNSPPPHQYFFCVRNFFLAADLKGNK